MRFNKEVGERASLETLLSGSCGLPVERTDNRKKLLRFYADDNSSFSSTNFQCSWRRTPTCRSKPTDSLIQIARTSVSEGWRDSV